MPEEEKIRQEVNISGQARTGDITLIGKLEQIVQIIRQPAAWQDEIWRFITGNRPFFAAAAVAAVVLAGSFFAYRNLYLISPWYLGLALTFSTAACWGWHAWFRGRRARRDLVFLGLASLSLFGALGWKAYQAAFPPRFSPQSFGIALGELGEGPDYQRTRRVREISDQVFIHLCQAIEPAQAREVRRGFCTGGASQSEAGRVELMRVGVLPDARSAEAYGRRIGADVVIWGNLLTSGERQATIRFQVLETPNRAINPEYPLVLPVTTNSAEIFARELDLESDPVKLKEVVAHQSTVISMFTLGLVSYLDWDFPNAVNRLETSIRYLEGSESLAISPAGTALIEFYLGGANHALGRLDEGQEWLLRASELNRSEPAIPISLALGYRSLGDFAEMEANLDRALRLLHVWLQTHPEDATALYNRGIVHHIRKEYEDAYLDYEAALARSPQNYVAHLSLGQAAVELKRYEQAEDAFLTGIRLAGESGANPSWAHLNLALVYQRMERPEEAQEQFQTAIRFSPGTDWMYFFYARFLDSRGETEAALEAYRKLIQVTQNQGWGHDLMGRFLSAHGLKAAALENYRRAVHARPEDALLRSRLALLYFELGELDRAVEEFEAALEIEEDSYYVYASYGFVLDSAGRYEEAAEMYARSLALRPDDEQVLLNLGRVYEINGEAGRAREVYREILSYADRFSSQTLDKARQRLSALGEPSP